MAVFCSAVTADSDAVRTNSGAAKGRECRHDSIEVFKANPYPAAPVDDLRCSRHSLRKAGATSASTTRLGQSRCRKDRATWEVIVKTACT